MEYKVDIKETYKRTVVIEAVNEDEAYEKIEYMIESGEIDLPCDGGDYNYSRDLFVTKKD